MSRILFVVPPLTGHTNPTVAVGRELIDRGHTVAWCGFADALRALLPDDAEVLGVGSDVPQDLVDAIAGRSKGLRGAAAFKFLWEDFLGPLADVMAPAVDAAVAAWAPDVMVVDQQAVAGALVAIQRGIPWATSATTSADLADPLAALPKLREWVDERLTAFASAHGLDLGADGPDALRLSRQLVIAFTTEALVGTGPGLPPSVAFVGPAFGGRPDRSGFPWEWIDGDGPERRPLVLVTLGTVNADAGERFFRAAVEALGDGPFQAVLVAPDGLLGDALPANVLVRSRVPQVALLERVDAVVTHGGHNTVCEALAQGLPLVVAPIRDDQPIVADQVVAAGAGVRVKFARVGAVDLRAAVDHVLADPAVAAAAARVGASFAAAGGAAAAADHIEALLAADPVPADHVPADPVPADPGART